MRRPNGTGSISGHGYCLMRITGQGNKYQHQRIAEAALGRPLRFPERVHHINGIKADNRPDNMVICPTEKYHQLLHIRQRALDACGNPDWRKCVFCKTYDSIENMAMHTKVSMIHRTCDKERRDKLK